MRILISFFFALDVFVCPLTVSATPSQVDGLAFYTVDREFQIGAMVALPDNSVLVAGYDTRRGGRSADPFDISYHSAKLKRLLPNGHYDESFGADGVLTLLTPFDFHCSQHINCSERASDDVTVTNMVRLKDRSLLLVGRGAGGSENGRILFFLKLTSDYKRDPNFGINGFIGVPADVFGGVKIYSAGRLEERAFVVTSSEHTDLDGGLNLYLVGSRAIDLIALRNLSLYPATQIEATATGKIALSKGNLLIQLLPNGQLDRSFGSAGIQTFTYFANAYSPDGIQSWMSLPTGGYLVPAPHMRPRSWNFAFRGTCNDRSEQPALFMVGATGQIDRVITNKQFNLGIPDPAGEIAIKQFFRQKDGSAFVLLSAMTNIRGGYVCDWDARPWEGPSRASGPYFALVKLNADGTPDPNFIPRIAPSQGLELVQNEVSGGSYPRPDVEFLDPGITRPDGIIVSVVKCFQGGWRDSAHSCIYGFKTK